jgi:hypothetical protein
MDALCPCPIGSKQRLVETLSFRDAGSGSDEEAPAPTTLADKAKGWFEMAAKPLATYRESQAKAAERAERVDVLKRGAGMKLLPDSRGQAPKDVRVALAADGSMLTWSGTSESGVMALSAVRDIKAVTQTGIFSRGGDVPCQWMLVSDDQTVRFEAASEADKLEWMQILEECRVEQCEAKSGRKLASQAKRRMGLEEKRRDAERRKAEVMKTCSSGGMKHTAAAMMSRV